MLTTKHLSEMQEHHSRTEVKQKPTAVIVFTANMCRIDLSDQLIAYNLMHRKTIKWWKKLAFHMLSITLLQAQILHNKFVKAAGKRQWQLCDFAKDVCLGLVRNGGKLAKLQMRPVSWTGLSANISLFQSTWKTDEKKGFLSRLLQIG
ncbi:PiggyBac transposable element-derived protein 4 [Elysia marginata]|uniref:PiggyBac transposable element-derived protein 4 n=1 Tax=Elysia marginata TaxID=1093978 RepID=A0AAV4GVB3_9GAST|nr:PiggyBac transposable element-derived protein 4 [Elysia marginata]